MKKIEILRLNSLSRAPLVIEGFFFEGKDKDAPSVAIVGAMEGNTILPLYCASSMVNFLEKLESEDKILGDILVIPSINHYALNIKEHFWPLDKTDINMMFPGFDQGETTQRIAAKVFDAIKDYKYGVSLETRRDPANCIPHIRLLQSGYEDIECAKTFGLKIIHHKELLSIDTVTLQYNWQLWGAKAYSIMCPNLPQVDEIHSKTIIQSLVRFLGNIDAIDHKIFNGYSTNVITKDQIEIIKAKESGIFVPIKHPGDYVSNGEILGKVIHSLRGDVAHEFISPCDGMITCYYNQALLFENAVTFRIARVV